MGRGISPKPSKYLQRPLHHRDRRRGHAEHDQDSRDETHMKHRAAVEHHRPRRQDNLDHTLDRLPGIDLVEDWLVNTREALTSVAPLPENVADPPETHHRRSNHHHAVETHSDQLYQRSAPGHSVQQQAATDATLSLAKLHDNRGRRRKNQTISKGGPLINAADNRRLSRENLHSTLQHLNAYADAETSQRSVSDDLFSKSSHESVPRPASPRISYTEKKLRRKTREDLYDTPKEKRQDNSKSQDDLQRHRSKKQRREDKKISLRSSQNVMKNFQPDAVMQDRITVQQPLAPGLFRNGRKANIKPVTDLAYTDMQFLRNRRSDGPTKPLSRKRLLELERQSKEIEETSAFFLPLQASHGEKRKLTASRGTGDHEKGERAYEQILSESSLNQERRATNSPSFTSYEPGIRRPIFESCDIPGTPQKSSKVSRATTYLTWSESPSHSPVQYTGQVSQAVSLHETPRSDTPESVRRMLHESGIFQGISHHGNNGHASDVRERNDNLTDNSAQHARAGDEQFGSESNWENTSERKTDESTGSIQLELLKARWETLFPREWRAQEENSHIDLSETDVQKDDRFSQLEQTKANADDSLTHSLQQGSTRNQRSATDHSQAQRLKKVSANLVDTNNDDSLGHCVDRRCSHTPQPRSAGSSEGLSLTSRDIMPPPPIPLCRPVSNSIQAPKIPVPVVLNPHHPTAEEITRIRQLVGEPEDVNNVTDSPPSNQRYRKTQRGTLVDNSKMFASIQSASWLPRPYTPLVATPLPGEQASRGNDKCQLYTTQISVAPGTDQGNRLSSTSQQETLENFIARIEDEVLRRTPELIWPNSEVGEAVKHCSYQEDVSVEEDLTQLIDDHHDFRGLEEQDAIISRLGSSRWQNELDPAASNSPNAFQHTRRATAAWMAEERQIEELNEFEEEKNEMSEFWGRNQFMSL